MLLILPDALRDELIAHAREGDPDEVCGMLAGRLLGQGASPDPSAERAIVERVFRVRNSAEEVEAGRGVFRDRETGEPAAGRRAVHYYMDPRDQLRIYNAVDDLGLEVVGYYHSHTHTEARPSPTDIRLATDLAAHYLLVGTRAAGGPVVRAWRIVKDDPAAETGQAIEVPVVSRADGAGGPLGPAGGAGS